MQKPEESLDDFTVKAMEIEKVSVPPAVVWLRYGGTEQLKPLAKREREPTAIPNTYRFSWFQSALAASGALAVMALILLSAIFIGIYDPPPGTEFAVNTGEHSIEPVFEEPLHPEVAALAEVPTHSLPKPAHEKRVHVAAHKPRPRTRRPLPALTRFIPTTLVISAENGEIKTRIEPQLAAVYKGP